VVAVAQESGCGRPCGRFFNTDRWSGNFGWPPRAARQPARPPTVTAGQKIAYVTDVADTPANRAAIVALVQNADILFIEAAFAGADAALARERAHLTTTAAGEIAREANVRRVEPFHFSPRYAGEQERMLAEVMTAFQGSHA
jgi:Metal-dependent hydrolases of the beta-lactamase superfamily III